MTTRGSRVVRICACVLGSLLACLSTARANTVVQTLRDGRPVTGVEVAIVKVVSGKSVATATSGAGGFAVFPDLEEGTRYEAQTADGRAYTEPFDAGATVELETGQGGWELALGVGGVAAASTAKLSSDCAACLDVEKTNATAYLDVDLMLFGRPRSLLFAGTRPFLTTGVEVSVGNTESYVDPNGGTANIEDKVGWKIGLGLASPVDIAGYTMRLEPSVRYVLMKSDLTSHPVGSDVLTEDFTTHAIEAGLASELPVWSLDRMRLSAVLSFSAFVPVAGSGELDSGLVGEHGVGYRGMVGLRATVPASWGAR